MIVGKRNEFEPTQYIVKVPDTTGMRTLDVARSLDQQDDVEFACPNYLTGSNGRRSRSARLSLSRSRSRCLIMPHYYSASGTPIQLDEAPDSIGVRFEGETGPAVARRAVRALMPAPTRRAASDTERRPPTTAVQHFGRFMLLRESRAAERPVETVVSALPRRLATHVSRYDARVRRARIKAQTGCDRPDSGVVQAERLHRAHANAAA